MVQYIIKVYNVTIKDIGLMQWIGLFYFLFNIMVASPMLQR